MKSKKVSGAKIIQGIQDWAEAAYHGGWIDQTFWEDEQELAASLQSYILGINPLPDTPVAGEK